MKTVAIMPIKLKNERLPGKNTKLLAGKPLLQYQLLETMSTGRYVRSCPRGFSF